MFKSNLSRGVSRSVAVSGGCSDDSDVERFFSGVFFSADFMDGEVMMLTKRFEKRERK